MAKEIGRIIEIKATNRALELFYFPEDKRIVSRVKTKEKHLLKGFKVNDKVELVFYNNYNESDRGLEIKGFDNNWLEHIKHV